MRVVTYARVSTEQQGSLGQSLKNQARKFERWRTHGGHEVVRSYEEAASAGSVAKRALFQRMIAELDDTRPDCIVVDTMDRFSRNLEDALDVIRHLRQRRINIWPLDWDRAEPPDVVTYDSPDYLRAREEVIAAQAERKRIATRIRRSYEGRRERGATTVQLAPFGTRLDAGCLVPSADAWIVAEADRRLLAGESPAQILVWARTVSESRSWGSRTGLRAAFVSRRYVEAGIRSDATAASIRAILRGRDRRIGVATKHDHEFTGTFACGRCVELGFAPAVSLMGEQLLHDPYTKAMVPALTCQTGARIGRRHPTFTVRVNKIVDAWAEIIDELAVDERAIARWERNLAAGDGAKQRRALERRIAALDGEDAALAKRRDRAFDMLDDATPAVAAQARKLLTTVERDERLLFVQRETLRGELAKIDAPPADAATLRAAIATYRDVYANATIAQRNGLNRALVAAIGSSPVVYRDGDNRWASIVIAWPAVLKEPIRIAYRSSQGPRKRRRLAATHAS